MKLYLLSQFHQGFTSWEGCREYRKRTASFQRGQPGHSQQLLTLGPAFFMEKCPSTLRTGTFTNPAPTSFSLSVGVSHTGAHLMLTPNLPGGATTLRLISHLRGCS